MHSHSAFFSLLVPAAQSFVWTTCNIANNPSKDTPLLSRRGTYVSKARQPRPTAIMSSGDGTSSTTTNGTMMKLLNGVADIADQFDIFLLDMWGVMHDGSRPYDGVLDVVDRLRHMPDNKKLIILSNSSKRRDNSARMLKKLGFDPDDFDDIITSGEVAHSLLSGKLSQRWDIMVNLLQQTAEKSSKKVFVFGSGDDDVEYCESCGWHLSSIEEANLIVARGTFTVNDGSEAVNKRENAALYESTMEARLQQAAVRRIPMLITNPDKVRPDAERPPMPGKIGDRYEQILRETAGLSVDECTKIVKRIGKPFQDVYDLALAGIVVEKRTRVCMVGDAIETDVVGGCTNGITTVWVLLDGIYGSHLDPTAAAECLVESAEGIVKEFNVETGTYAGDRIVKPDLLLRHFCW